MPNLFILPDISSKLSHLLEIFIFSPLNFIFLMCVCVQLFYFLFFFRRLGAWGGEQGAVSRGQFGIDNQQFAISNKTIQPFNNSTNAPRHEPVSVIVCVLNEGEYIKKLLPALLGQHYPEFEVVVVSDRSSDELYDWLLFERFSHKNLKIVRVNQLHEHITPKKFALTLGIKASKYEQILLTDADCTPASENWIAEMQNCFSEQKSLVLGVSQYNYYKGWLNFIIRHETFNTAVQYLSFALAGVPYMGVGRNLAYKKTLFLKNKGFHSHQKITGGDDDLFVKEVATGSNTALCISPESQTFSEPKRTWQTWFRQKRRHLSVGKYYQTKHKVLLSALSLSQVGFWLFFLGIVLFQEWNILFLTGFLLRNVVFLTIQQANIRCLHANIKWYGLPVFDIFYVFYYIIVGISAVFAKKVKWS